MRSIVKTLAAAVALTLMSLLAPSCGSYPVETVTGKEDMAYLTFVSQEGEYAKRDVVVSLDNGTTFKAEPVKERKADMGGTLYKVAPGKREIVVKNRSGEVIYRKTIMLYAQQTKQILLP